MYGIEYFIGNYYEMILDIIKITTVDKPFCNSFNSKTFIELHKKLNNTPDNVNQQIDIKNPTKNKKISRVKFVIMYTSLMINYNIYTRKIRIYFYYSITHQLFESL